MFILRGETHKNGFEYLKDSSTSTPDVTKAKVFPTLAEARSFESKLHYTGLNRPYGFYRVVAI